MMFDSIDVKELIQRILGLPFEFFNHQVARVKHRAYKAFTSAETLKYLQTLFQTKGIHWDWGAIWY